MSSVQELSPVLLQARDVHTQLAAPLGGGKRVKFTSVDQGRNFLALGANTGSVYVYKRQNLQFVKLLSNVSDDLSPIRVVRLSPDEKYLSLSTESGNLLIVELKLHKLKSKEKVTLRVAEHAEHKVTAICWDAESRRVFSGDDQGLVVMSVVNAASYSLFRNCDLVCKEESPIVQLDYQASSQSLLVSSYQRSLLVDTKAQKPQGSQYMVATQIGSAKRNGPYGGCFGQSFSGAYCSRPGKTEKRIWKVDVAQAKVQATLKFAVDKVPSRFIEHDGVCVNEAEDAPPAGVPFSLSKLLPFGASHLITWTPSAVGIVDPVSVKLISWHIALGEIVDLSVFGESFVAIHGADKTVSFVTDVPAPVYLERLINTSAWTRAAVFARARSVEQLPLLYTLYETMNAIEREDDEDGAILENLKSYIVELETKQAAEEASSVATTFEDGDGNSTKGVLKKARSTLTSLKEFYRKSKVTRHQSLDTAAQSAPTVSDPPPTTETAAPSTKPATGVVRHASADIVLAPDTTTTAAVTDPAPSDKSEAGSEAVLADVTEKETKPDETKAVVVEEDKKVEPVVPAAEPVIPAAVRKPSVDAVPPATTSDYDASAPDVPATISPDLIVTSTSTKSKGKKKKGKKKRTQAVDIAPATSPAKSPAPNQVISEGADWSPGAHAEDFVRRLKAKDPSLVPRTPPPPSAAPVEDEPVAVADVKADEDTVLDEEATRVEPERESTRPDDPLEPDLQDAPIEVTPEPSRDDSAKEIAANADGVTDDAVVTRVEDEKLEPAATPTTPPSKAPVTEEPIPAAVVAEEVKKTSEVEVEEPKPVPEQGPVRVEEVAEEDVVTDKAEDADSEQVTDTAAKTEGTENAEYVTVAEVDSPRVHGEKTDQVETAETDATETGEGARPVDEVDEKVGDDDRADETDVPDKPDKPDEGEGSVGGDQSSEPAPRQEDAIGEEEFPVAAFVVPEPEPATSEPVPAEPEKKVDEPFQAEEPAKEAVESKEEVVRKSKPEPAPKPKAEMKPAEPKKTAKTTPTPAEEPAPAKPTGRGSIAQEAMSDLAREITSKSQHAYSALSTYRADRNTDALRPTLTDWLHALDSTVKEGESHLAAIPSLWIHELTTACFELRIAPPGSPEVPLTEKWTDAQATLFINQYFLYLDKSRCFKLCVQNQFKDSIKAMHALEDIHDPSHSTPAMSRQSIQQCIDAKDGKSALERIQKRGSLGLTLRFLGPLFALAQSQTVDYCLTKFPSLQPWCVEAHLRKTDPHAYVEYLWSLISSHEVCRSNIYLIAHYIHCMLEVDPRPANQDEGFGIGAHRATWTYHDKLQEIIQHPERYPCDREYLIAVFTTRGYYQGALYLLQADNQIAVAVELCISVDDLSSFIALMSDATDDKDWERVIRQLLERDAQLSGDAKENGISDREITPLVILQTMRVALGPVGTIKILQGQLDILNGVPSEFYKDLISCAGVGIQQGEHLHHLLEKVNSHMWTHKTSTLAPQYRQFRDEELSQPRMADSMFVRSTIDGPELAFQHTSSLPAVFDDNTTHWGVEVDVTALGGTCSLCTLPLAAQLGTASDLMVYACGHAFHSYCVSDDVCVSCLQQNFVSVDPAKRNPLAASNLG